MRIEVTFMPDTDEEKDAWVYGQRLVMSSPDFKFEAPPDSFSLTVPTGATWMAPIELERV